MTKIEAIAHLENAMKHNPEYMKKWRDHIELAVTEELMTSQVPSKKIYALRQRIANRVLRLFQADWWEAQGEQ